MALIRFDTLLPLVWLLVSATAEPAHPGHAAHHGLTLQHIANVSYADTKPNLSALASIFSPRMDFDQWKPLTGRGDPLRNDPTYDYEPPVLERVHYWADDTRYEREQYPERKSEVLMLGVSSRKPSVGPPRHSHPPPRRHRPHPPKYEDYSYKLSEQYPMTILVPPPRPPPGHKPSLFILDDTASKIITDPPKLHTTVAPQQSSYALQESNLIFQASTTNHDWVFDYNITQPVPNNAASVSSDYMGWGPTTPLDDSLDGANDTHNLISNDHLEFSNHPYSFYKPMLSEAPPPPRVTKNPLLLPTFLPTSLPSLLSIGSGFTTAKPYVTQPTWPTEVTETETPTEIQDYDVTTTTEKYISTKYYSTPIIITRTTKRPEPQPETSLFDMLHPMMSMPLTDGPERQEDNLYAHASENLHIFKENEETTTQLETMQTMQPPPPVVKATESASNTQRQPPHTHSHNNMHNFIPKKPSLHTHDPYLHMRFTTPMPTAVTSTSDQSLDNTRTTTEAPAVPMYLIIQGHSKVKTYGFKPKPIDENDTINNEITKPNESDQVKHLHPKDKYAKPEKLSNIRTSRAHDLKTLVEQGHGSIEIQEANLGIKYDVSDGSEVPVEIYRKGIVENDENDYTKSKKRTKRQFDLEDVAELLPDETFLDGYVYKYLEDKQNSTGLTGMIAKVVAGGTGSVIDELDESDEESDEEDDDEDR